MDSPPAPDQPSGPEYSHRRTGKVARLPKIVRDQINQMLLDGVPYPQIIEKLGAAATGILEDNIRTWKAGGYEDWLRELQRAEALAHTREAALGLVSQKAGATVQDAGRAVAAAQLYELLLAFDPSAFATALVDNPELYLRLINSLSRLSEGEAACGHRRAQESLIEAKLHPAQPGNGPNVIAADTLKEIARLIKLL